MKDELAGIAKEYARLYESSGLCGIASNRVQLLREDFEKMFSEYETRYRENGEYNTEEFALYDGVEFFCLVKGQEHEEA